MMTLPEDPLPVPAPEEKKSKKVKIIKPYTIPQWFQNRCVRTIDQLAETESGLVIVRSTDKTGGIAGSITRDSVRAQSIEHSEKSSELFADAVKVSGRQQEDTASDTDGSEKSTQPATDTEKFSHTPQPSAQDDDTCYSINEDVFLSLKNTVGPALTINDEVSAFEQPSGIVIQVESVEALRHADAAVVQLAKDFSTKLLVLDPEDIEDIATDFHAEQKAAEKVEKEEQRVKRAAKKAREEKKAAEEAAKKKKDDAETAEKKKREEAESAEEKKQEANGVTAEPLESADVNAHTGGSPEASKQAGDGTEQKAVEDVPASKGDVADEKTAVDTTETPDADSAEIKATQTPSSSSEVESAASEDGSTSQQRDSESEPTEKTDTAIAPETSASADSEAEEEDDPDDNNNPPADPIFPCYDGQQQTTEFYALTSHYFCPWDEQTGYKQAKSRGSAALKYLITGQEPEPEDDTVKPKSLAAQVPVIIHVRYANRLAEDNSGVKVFNGLKTAIKACRSIAQKVVLLVSTVSNEDPFRKDESETETSDPFGFSAFGFNPFGTSQKDLASFLKTLGVDESAAFELKTIQKVEELRIGPADSQKGINIQRLKRYIRHGYPETVTWLDPSSDWLAQDSRDILSVLGRDDWKDHKIRQAARQIVGRGLTKDILAFADVLSVLEMMSRTVDQKDKEKTEAARKFDEKLAKVRKQCNTHELRLLDSVIKPCTLESSYDDVIIDAETKDTVKQLVSLFKLKTTCKSEKLLKLFNINGAMFFGPPGVGKTHLCRAMATDQNACMLSIDPSTIGDMYVGEQEKMVKASFTLATKLSPCILFLDEADALFRKRTPCDKSWERSSLTMFLQMMDGISTDKKRPFVVTATNRPSDLDAAFLRRLPHKVMFKLPSEQHRAEILKLSIDSDNLDKYVTHLAIAKLTDGYSGSDLKNLVGQAVLVWATENATRDGAIMGDAEHNMKLTFKHFHVAMRRCRPTVSRQSLLDIESFAQQYCK